MGIQSPVKCVCVLFICLFDVVVVVVVVVVDVVLGQVSDLLARMEHV